MLTENTEVQGKPCRGGPVSIAFYDGGKLKSCGASQDIEISGYTIKANQTINIFDDGALMTAYLNEAREIDGKQCTSHLRTFPDLCGLRFRTPPDICALIA